MAIKITKSEKRLKPVTMMRNQTAWFLTLANRAANWMPFAQKHDDAHKSDERITDMAAEFIQAVIAPLDGNLDKLREVLGPDEFAKLNLQNAEKHDNLTKYIQAPERRFVKLDAMPLGDTGINLIFGALKNAEKADSMVPMPAKMGMPEPWRITDGSKDIQGEPFRYLLERKVRALTDSICAAVELSDDWDKIEKDAQAAIDGLDEWISDAIGKLRELTPPAQKSDETDSTGKIGWTRRFLNALSAGSKTGQTNITITQKGDDPMTLDEKTLKNMLTDVATEAAAIAAKATVQEMVEKADAEEREKATSEARKKELAEKAERDAKLDKILAHFDKLVAEKGESDDDPEKLQAKLAELAQKHEEEMKKLAEKNDAEIAELKQKLNLIGRTAKPSGGSDGVPPNRAEKADDPLTMFDGEHGMGF